jgi:RNA polymerase sigma factor (TIGR02999 family)
MGVAAQLMRRILVDHARRRAAAKRVAPDQKKLLAGVAIEQIEEILAVNEVLTRLDHLDPQQARIVELRYFGGLSVEETAEVMGISSRTVKRDWAMAKAWLREELAARELP